MRNISSWAIKNPIPVILLFLLLSLAGVAAFKSMRINNNPDVDFPFVVVTAVRPGAAPRSRACWPAAVRPASC